MGFAVGPSSASATGETVEISMAAESISGPLFREVARPVDANLYVRINAGPQPPSSSPANKVTQLKVSNVTFPADMAFHPNQKVTPACPESKIGPTTNLSLGTLAIYNLCPDSVIGTGKSSIFLNGLPSIPLNDPVLLIFNSGLTKSGRPKITIYGFSKQVNYGVLMTGVLAKDGQLRIEVGMLAASSSVKDFTLGIPGEPLQVDDPSAPGGVRTIVGGDPAYLRGKCSTGSWKATGKFVLGNRDESTGLPTGPESFLSSNPFTLPCKGLKGKPRLVSTGSETPVTVKSGSRAVFRLLLANRGTATARSMSISSPLDRNRIKAGNLAPGGTKSVKVSGRVAGRPGSKRTLKFSVRIGAKQVLQIKRQVLIR